MFTLRAQQISALRGNGRIAWIKETGTRVRMLSIVEAGLLPLRSEWESIADASDPNFVNSLLEWAWSLREIREAAREGYRAGDEVDINTLRESTFQMVRLWLSGATFADISRATNLSIDDTFAIHSKVVAFALQTVVEQGLGLLGKLLEDRGQNISPAVVRFSEHLRFGVPSVAGCTLAAGGVYHRRAIVEIGKSLDTFGTRAEDRSQVFDAAQNSLEAYTDTWRLHLGTLVFQRTMRDLSSVTLRRPTGE